METVSCLSNSVNVFEYYTIFHECLDVIKEYKIVYMRSYKNNGYPRKDEINIVDWSTDTLLSRIYKTDGFLKQNQKANGYVVRFHLLLLLIAV